MASAEHQRRNARAQALGFDNAYHQRVARAQFKATVGVAARTGSNIADLLGPLAVARISPADFRRVFRFDINDRAAWTALLSP